MVRRYTEAIRAFSEIGFVIVVKLTKRMFNNEVERYINRMDRTFRTNNKIAYELS